MQLALLGVGGAGCRLTQRMVAAEPAARSYISNVRAFDTDADALAALDVPDEDCLQFADRPGHRSPDAAGPRDAAEENAQEIRRLATDGVTAAADAVLVVAGLGGATGAGAAPVIADTVGEEADVPVYALSVLPNEAEGDQETENAGAGLRGLEATVDAQLVVDNGRRSAVTERLPDADAALAYEDENERIARWLSVLFGAGESSGGAVGESVVDASEIIATLGESGYVMLGCERQQVREPPSLLDRLLSRESTPDEIETYSTIETAVRRALLRHRSFDADLTLAERSLLVTVGPPDWLNREAIADGRGVVAEETGRSLVRGGDTPLPDGTDLTVLVVCAGLPRHGRLSSLAD